MKFLCYFFVLLSCICLPSTARSQEAPTIADFIEEGTESSYSLSPNGKLLALLKDDEDESRGENYIEIRNLQEDRVIRRLSNPDYRFWSVSWYDDNRVLIAASKPRVFQGMVKLRVERALRKRGASKHIFKHSRLFIMDIDGRNFTRLFKTDSRLFEYRQNITEDSIVDVLKNDPDHMLLKAWGLKGWVLWRTNTHTGATERVENGNKKSTTGWMTNVNGVPTIRYETYHGGRVLGISIRRVGDKNWTEVSRLRAEDTKKFNPILPTNDPEIFIVSALKEGEDKIAYYMYDIAKKKIVGDIFSHDKVDVNSIVFDTDRKPLGFSFVIDKRDYTFTDPDFLKRYERLKNTIGGEQNITLLEISKDHRFWLVYTSSPTNPGAYYYFDSDTSDLTTYAVGSTRIEATQLGKMEIVNYEASDGVKISGYLTHPAANSVNSGETTPPLIVFPHGGPEDRDRYDFNTFVQFFASRGYMVFQPNFRGSSGYGRKFVEAGYGEWGRRMQDDITDGVNALYMSGHMSGKIDRDNMCIAGISYGGYAALAAAMKTPDTYKCAISINGVSDLMDILKYDKAVFGGKSASYAYVKKTIGDPKKDEVVIRQNSPIDGVEKMKVPILLINSELDDIVPVRQGRNMYSALQKAGHDVEYLEIEHAGHSLARPESMEAALLKLETYLAKHLPVEE